LLDSLHLEINIDSYPDYSEDYRIYIRIQND